MAAVAVVAAVLVVKVMMMEVHLFLITCDRVSEDVSLLVSSTAGPGSESFLFFFSLSVSFLSLASTALLRILGGLDETL